MLTDPSMQHAPHTRRIMLLGGFVVVTALLALLQWRVLASVEDTYHVAVTELDQMRTDVEAICSLRQAPVTASARQRTNQELLAQVERALAAAGIDRASWLDSVPQPPVRVPGSDYKRFITRLYFENLSLQQLAVFALELERRDPTLEVSGFNVTNRRSDAPGFDLELSVAYLVYALQRSNSEPAIQ